MANKWNAALKSDHLPHPSALSELFARLLHSLITHSLILVVLIPLIVDLYINYLFQLNQSISLWMPSIAFVSNYSLPTMLVSAKKCKKGKEIYAIETKKYIPVPYPVKTSERPMKKRKKKSSAPKTIVVTIPEKKKDEDDCCGDYYDYLSIAPPLYYDYYQYYGGLGGGGGSGGLRPGGFGGGGLGGFGGGGLGGGGGFGGGGLGGFGGGGIG